ncbi:hypothetical protein WR25_24320 [Diploscapter pachys]|uniref:7TM GPCR serpentine receptor class x (Srx) domain-containing protein n=1 Tax=Diploscapter pachys TaxID=2018661 RepID=A0A2A2M075_9BILA|nr:hypothetical protein WR25_24320 [Diploscapter pachys]
MPFTVYEHANDPLNYFMGMLIFSDATIGLVCNIFIILMFFQNANQYICILLALNRFIALYFYNYYNKFCAIKPTLLLLIAIDLLRLGIVSDLIYGYLTDIENNNFYFDPDMMSCVYPVTNDIPNATATGDSDPIGLYELTTKIYTVSTLALNILTFLKISYHYIAESQTETQVARERIKKNAKLFLQTFLQDSLYIVDMLFMIHFSTLSDSRFWGFISWTFVWCNVHSVDGVIMLLFTEHKKSLSSLFMQTSTKDEKQKWASRTSQR